MRSPMQIYEFVEHMLNEKGVSDRQMMQDAGLKRGTLDNMKKGSMPSADKIVIIAGYLGVSIDFLLGIEKPIEPIALRATVREWTEILNNMTDENLIKLRDYARLLLLQQHSQAAQEGQESRK